MSVNTKVEQGNEIEGAAFRLKNSSGAYNETISSGSTFVFTDIQPGVYYLKELTAPNGYTGLEEEITIDIFDIARLLASICSMFAPCSSTS